VLAGTVTEAMARPPLPRPEVDTHAVEESPQAPEAKKRRPRRRAALQGFSLHAGTTVAATHRLGLEKLCRYGPDNWTRRALRGTISA